MVARMGRNMGVCRVQRRMVAGLRDLARVVGVRTVLVAAAARTSERRMLLLRVATGCVGVASMHLSARCKVRLLLLGLTRHQGRQGVRMGPMMMDARIVVSSTMMITAVIGSHESVAATGPSTTNTTEHRVLMGMGLIGAAA